MNVVNGQGGVNATHLDFDWQHVCLEVAHHGDPGDWLTKFGPHMNLQRIDASLT